MSKLFSKPLTFRWNGDVTSSVDEGGSIHTEGGLSVEQSLFVGRVVHGESGFDAHGHVISNVGTAVEDADAVNRAFVDAVDARISSRVDNLETNTDDFSLEVNQTDGKFRVASAGIGAGLRGGSGAPIELNSDGQTVLVGTDNAVHVNPDLALVQLHVGDPQTGPPMALNDDGINLQGKRITGLPTASSGPTDAVSRAELNATEQGLELKDGVRCTTLNSVTIATDLVPGGVLDGVTLVEGDRVLVKDQGAAPRDPNVAVNENSRTSHVDNGIYVVGATGAVATRAADFAEGMDVLGAYVFVEEGAVNSANGYVVRSGRTVGTDALTFTQFTGLGDVIAGSALSMTGNQLDVQVDAGSLEIVDDRIRLKASQPTVTQLGAQTTLDVTGRANLGEVNVSGPLTATNGVIIADPAGDGNPTTKRYVDGAYTAAAGLTKTAGTNGYPFALSVNPAQPQITQVGDLGSLRVVDGLQTGSTTANYALSATGMTRLDGQVEVTGDVTVNGTLNAPSTLSQYQPVSAVLTGLATATPTLNNFLLGSGTSWTSVAGPAARLALALGALATKNTVSLTTDVTGVLPVANFDSAGIVNLGTLNQLSVAGLSTFARTLTIGPNAVSGTPSATTGRWLDVPNNTFTDATSTAGATITDYIGLRLGRTTLTAANAVTTTNASTLYIDGPPLAGTNQTLSSAYSLNVATGTSKFAAVQAASVAVSGTLSAATVTTGNSVVVAGNAAGEVGGFFNNANATADAFSSVRLGNNTPNAAILFLNSSARTADGGVNSLTLRNDAGRLRLQSSGSKGLSVAPTSGDVTTDGGLTVNGQVNINSAYTIMNTAGVAGAFQINNSYFGYAATAGQWYTANSAAGDTIIRATGAANANGTLRMGTNITTSNLDILPDGSVNVNSGALKLTNGTTNLISYTTGGVNPPSVGTRSSGTKLVLFPSLSAAFADFAIGMEGGNMWHSVGTRNDGFTWYGGTTRAARLDGAGNLELSGALTVAGNVDGEIGGTFNNANAGTGAYSSIRIGNNTANAAIMFLNSSARTTDGGANTLTLRNDAGGLRLQSSAWKGLSVSAASGDVIVDSGTLSLISNTSNVITYTSNGVNPPSFTTRSTGTKLVLYPSLAPAAVDFAVGIEGANMWHSVDGPGSGFKWYGGTTQVARLDGAGNFALNGALTTGGAIKSPVANTFTAGQYPPAALTGYTTNMTGQPYGNGTYVVSVSSADPSVAPFTPFSAFSLSTVSAEEGWHSSGVPANSYTGGTGVYAGTVTTTVGGATIAGEWIQLQCPVAFTLKTTMMVSRAGYGRIRMPRSFIIAGSNDGATWTTVYARTEVRDWVTSGGKTFKVNANTAYSRYRLIVREVGNFTSGAEAVHSLNVNMAEWQLFDNHLAVEVTSPVDATEVGTGALQVAGGVSVAKSVVSGGQVSGLGFRASEPGANNYGAMFMFEKERQAVLNDELGVVGWFGRTTDSTLSKPGAYMIAHVDAVNATTVSGGVSFVTTDAAGGQATRLKIAGSGVVGVMSGTLTIGPTKSAGTAADTTTVGLERSRYSINFANFVDYAPASVGASIQGVNKQTYTETGGDRSLRQSTDLVFSTTPPNSYANSIVERMRILDTGGVLMGIGAGDARLNIQDINANLQSFYYGGAKVGGITTNNTSTSYNTTSDYRLKENVAELSGIEAVDRLKRLPVKRFNFKGTDTTVDGYLAHEVADIVPEAVTGTKDAVDTEGKPVYQMLDASKLVPMLTAALKQALTRIEVLEGQVAQLTTTR